MSKSSELSPGRSLLKQMREEKYAQQAHQDAEFQRIARANLQHGHLVRESQVNKARVGGAIFSTDGQSSPRPTPRQPDQAKSLIYGSYVEPMAKENNRNFEGYNHGADPYYEEQHGQQARQAEYSKQIQGGYRDYQEVQQPQPQFNQPPVHQQYQGGNYDGAHANGRNFSGSDNVAAKYDEMLADAAMRRVRERTAPRSTSFY